MGIFSKKKKISVDEMAMQAMLAAIDVVGKVENFEDADDEKAMAISIGYFYGFLKLHLNSITGLDTANLIVEKSITNIENATKGKPEFINIGKAVRTSSNIALASMKDEIKKRPENPFMGVATDYLKELYNNPPSIDVGKMLTMTKSVQLLYGVASNLTKDIKIVK